MEGADELRPLLEEIRDLQREQLEIYREQSVRSLQLAEESVSRQANYMRIYKRVLLALALLLVPVVWVLWRLLSRM